MAQLTNTFEGGSNGTTVTSGAGGNTGGASGNFFDVVSIAAGAVCAFSSTTPYEGSLCLSCGTRATSGNARVEWASSLASMVDDYGRCFIRLGASPPINSSVINLYSDDLAVHCSIRINTTRTLSTLDLAGGVLATSSTALTVGAWYRLEWHAHADTSAASLTVRIYATPTAAVGSFTEEFGATPTFAGSANIGAAIYGVAAAANWPSASTTLDFDAIVEGATTWVGPLSGTGGTIQAIAAVSTALGSTYEVDETVTPTRARSTASGRQPTISTTTAVRVVTARAAVSTARVTAPVIQGPGATVSPAPALSTAIGRGIAVAETPGVSVIGGVLLTDQPLFPNNVGLDDAPVYRRGVADVPVFAGAADDTPGH